MDAPLSSPSPAHQLCSLSPSSHCNRACGSGLLERESGPEDLDRIEGEFRIEAALNVAGLPKAMLLAREQEITDLIAVAPQRLNHSFRLVRRHDGVLLPRDGLMVWFFSQCWETFQ